jgi:predicted acyltransferase
VLEPGVNFSNYVDRVVFGRHVMSWAVDPEGLFGTVPATANALMGTLAGRWLRSSPDPRRRVAGLAAGAVVLLVAGYAWSHVIPFNKNLWTASYALFTSGIAAGSLAICYLLVDVLRVRRWARPFVWLGLNPLAIYFLSELVGHFMQHTMMIGGELWTPQSWLFWTKFEPLLGFEDPATSSLVVGLLTVTVWILLAWALYRKQIRIVV